MATILIVDDRPANREFLVTLLGYGGHRLLEAADGAEALAVSQTRRPDLVIADVLMPTMDGYEFVRRLRADPSIASTRVIFYTAHYHEPEARALAQECGVSGVLTKPCEPEAVLATVQAALGPVSPAPRAPEPEAFDREHLRLLTDKLSEKADELRRTNERLTAMVELGLQLGSERDPARLLQGFCDAAREIVGARHALVGVPDGNESPYRHFLTSGMDRATVTRIGRPAALTGVLGSVVAAGSCFRAANHADLHAAGMPPSFPPAAAVLVAPLASPTRVYGWVCLLDKLGADGFSEEDERLARMLGSQVGRTYENGRLYADLLRHSTKLAEEVAERKAAEQERDRFFTQSLNLLCVVCFDGRFRRVNPAWEESLGFTADELLAEPFLNFIHPDDRAATQTQVERLAAGEDTTAFECRCRRKDGSYRWIVWNATPFLDRDGFYASGYDITDRKRSEESLRVSERRFRDLANAIPQIVWIANPDKKLLYHNRHGDETIGPANPDDPTAVIHPDDRPAVARAWAEAIRTGSPLTCEFRFRMVDTGEYRWFLARAVAIRDDEGRIVKWYGTATDIHDQKQTQDELRRTATLLRAAEERLQHVVTSSPAVLFTLAVEGGHVRGISWISANLQELLGYPATAAADPNWWPENIHPDDRDRVMAETDEQLFTLGHVTDEYRFRHRDGKYRWTRGEIRLVRDALGRPQEAVGSWSDITEHKHLEAQFLQAQKMEAVGRLAGGVAHDFNNLLTVINGYSDLLIDGLSPQNLPRESLEQIRTAGERATGLTRQLLAFSRKAVLAPVVLDPNELLKGLSKMLARLIGEDINLRVVTAPGVGKIKVDPGQMEQVVMNLVVNARDAMPRGGKLTIETADVELDEAYAATHPDTPPGRYTLIAVSDTGHGMDEATRARIFEPFFTTKGPEKGTGLGLSVVHGVVKQSGGSVDVASEVGRGTTFKVYLPRVEEAATARTTQRVPSPRRGTETVLLVEDEDGVRSLARLVLERNGYTVLAARNGNEALRLGRQTPGPIHALVTDMVLPNMSGWELAQHLAAERPGTKVLYLSGYTDDAFVQHGIVTPDTPFLQKPFTPDALAAKLREVLEGTG